MRHLMLFSVLLGVSGCALGTVNDPDPPSTIPEASAPTAPTVSDQTLYVVDYQDAAPSQGYSLTCTPGAIHCILVDNNGVSLGLLSPIDASPSNTTAEVCDISGHWNRGWANQLCPCTQDPHGNIFTQCVIN